jgi:hypothetical protein
LVTVVQAGDLDQSAATITPQVNRTVAPSLIDQSSATITGPLVQLGLRTLFQNLSTLRGRSRVRASPSPRRGPFRLRGVEGQSTTRGNFRIRGAIQPDRVQVQVTPGLIDNSATVYAFGINSNTVFITSIIDQSATVTAFDQATFKPAFPLIDESAAAYAPAPSGLVTAPLIDNSAAVYAPTLNDKFVYLENVLDQSATPFGPTLNRKIYPGLIDQSAASIAPLVPDTNFVVSFDDVLDNSATTFAPDCAPVLFPLVDNSATMFQPVVQNPVLQFVRFDNDDAYFLDASAEAFQPEDVQVAPGRFVFPDFIDQEATPIAPFIFVPVPGTILKQGHYKPIIRKKGHYKDTIRKKGEYVT